MPTVKYDNTKYRGGWEPNTDYAQDDLVYRDGALWAANVAFTSGATFNEPNWTCSNCVGEDFSLDPSSVVTGVELNVVKYKYADKQTLTYEPSMGLVFGVKQRNDAGYYYLEFKSNVANGFRAGVSWDTGVIANLTNSILGSYGGSDVYVNGVSVGGVPPLGSNLNMGDILRVWIRNGKMWFGSIKNGIDYVNGDPLGDTGEFLTFTPTDPIRALIYTTSHTVVEYNAKSYNIECDPLGATPFED